MAKLSEVIVETLKEAGVRLVFGIPSVHNIGLYEALRKEASIRHILCRHEAGATHMADGYARAGNGVGVVITSTGPGACYMTAPLLEALGSCSPVLAITTNIRDSAIGQGAGAIHELEDQDKLFKNVTKAVFCLRSVKEARALTREAVTTALSGRPGPVYLEVPTNYWNQEIAARPESAPEKGGEDDLYGLDEAASMITQADSPVILAGTAAVRAGLGPQIVALAEIIQAPVLTVAGAKGIIPEDHDLSFGTATRRGVVRKLLESSDLTLAIGTRLRNADMVRRGLNLPGLIHVDWDYRWIEKNFTAEIALMGDIRRIATELKRRLEAEKPGESRRERIHELKNKLNEELSGIRRVQFEIQYLDAIRQVMPRQSSLVVDNTLLGYWAEYFYPSYMTGGFIPAKGSAIIGFAFPAAIGLRLAEPERPVAALIGDGGFFYGAQELATCIRHQIGFPVIVVNDKAYGVIDFLQKINYSRGYENDLVNPDLQAFANSFGISARRVKSPEELGQALEEALASNEMRVIELEAAFPETPFARY